jgi:hypothetical protein
MSREIVSSGAGFSIAYLDRAFGGRAKDIFVVDDATGNITINTAVTLNGTALVGSQSIVGDVVATGNADFGGTLGVDGAVTLDSTLAVGGASTFTGAVTLPSLTVTAAQLAAALGALVPATATLTLGGSAGAPTVTIQLKDARGTNIALPTRVSVWVSATAKGTPIGTSTTGLTTTFTTGVLALTKLANLDFDLISDTSGVVVAVLTDAAGAETRFVNVAVNGTVFASAAVISPA